VLADDGMTLYYLNESDGRRRALALRLDGKASGEVLDLGVAPPLALGFGAWFAPLP
jgi:hypothetical protein